MAVSSVGPTIVDLVESVTPFNLEGDEEEDNEGSSSSPAVLIVLASRRKDFFDEVYGTSEFDDRYDLYGKCDEPIRVDGFHFDVVTRCISNRVPEFTEALEAFLSTASQTNDDDSTPANAGNNNEHDDQDEE